MKLLVAGLIAALMLLQGTALAQQNPTKPKQEETAAAAAQEEEAVAQFSLGLSFFTAATAKRRITRRLPSVSILRRSLAM